MTCIVCGSYETDREKICSLCYSKIKYIQPFYCQKCGIPLEAGGEHCYRCLHPQTKIYYEYLRGVCLYDDIIRKCIHLYKYRGKDYLSETLSKLLVRFIITDTQMATADIIVPVPLHWWKQLQRGYNQAELFAINVAKALSKKVITGNLYRKRFTKAQVNLKRESRLKNVEDAFGVKHPEVFKDKTVLVIDDVCTTGETINQCAKALKKAGAKKIYGVTLARDT